MHENALNHFAASPLVRKRFTPATTTATGTTTLGKGQAIALAGIAHDARNLVTALKMCAELIAEPGVLTAQNAHFADQVRSISEASDHLIRRLGAVSRTATLANQSRVAEVPILDLSEAVRDLSALLAAIAGPAVGVQIACLPCAGALRISEENVTRILLNLVRNASDAMPMGGRIRITAQRGGGASFLWTLPSGGDGTGSDVWEEALENSGPPTVVLSVEDDGPGIAPELLEKIFEPGFSTRREGRAWPESAHHGLGLSIVRQLVEQAGGTVRATTPPKRGARFEIELPLTNVTPYLPSEPSLRNGSEGL